MTKKLIIKETNRIIQETQNLIEVNKLGYIDRRCLNSYFIKVLEHLKLVHSDYIKTNNYENI